MKLQRGWWAAGLGTLPGGSRRAGSWRGTGAGEPQEEQKQRAALRPAAPACVWEAAPGLGLAAVMLASRARPVRSVTGAGCKHSSAEQVRLLLLFRAFSAFQLFMGHCFLEERRAHKLDLMGELCVEGWIILAHYTNFFFFLLFLV